MTDLGLETVETLMNYSGRPSSGPALLEVVRPIDSSDIALLTLPRNEANPDTRSPLKRLSSRHHALAREIANGTPRVTACLMVGYSQPAGALLAADPAFKELVAFYTDAVERKYADMHENLAALGEDAVNIMRERLENAPEKMSDNMILETIKLATDRTGFGPSSQSVNVNIYASSADRLKAAREKARAAASGKLIEGTVREAAE